MKTKTMMSYCLVLVVSLFASAEVMAQGFRSRQPASNPQQVVYGAVAPSTTFHSTGSAMMSSGSAYSSNPTLNEDGTASYESASGPRRTSGPRKNPTIGNPDDDDDDDVPNPIGDAVWPLMLLACVYLIIRATRKRARTLKR